MSEHCNDCAPEFRECWTDKTKCRKQQSSFAASTGCAAPLPCPFCGNEAKIVKAAYGPRIYCNHDRDCLMNAHIVYDFQLRAWNRRHNVCMSDGGRETLK